MLRIDYVDRDLGRGDEVLMNAMNTYSEFDMMALPSDRLR